MIIIKGFIFYRIDFFTIPLINYGVFKFNILASLSFWYPLSFSH